MGAYFIRNKETEKVEIHFTKAEYLAMPDDRKKEIKSSCLFSKYKSCWISKAKIDGAYYIIRKLNEFGIEDRGETGERLTYAEKVEREQERAAGRAERMEELSNKNSEISTQRYEAAREIGSQIPMGQPILVGHHSEGRHRAAIAKIDNNMRKSCEASDKAAYYETRFKNAEFTAEGKKYKNAGYLVNRIKECEANIRTFQRRLEGKSYTYSTPKPISEEQAKYWNERMTAEQDKLEYMQYCLAKIQSAGSFWDKEKLQDKKQVKIHGRWQTIVRLNPTTVAVNNICFQEIEQQRKYALKYNYGEIQDAI